MLRAVVFGAVVGALLTGPARAQFDIEIPGLTTPATTPARQRVQVRPYIVALTDCVAKRTLDDDAAVLAFRDDGFSPYVRTMIERCPRYLEQLTQVYDQTYGPGQGQAFVDGPYAKDLPRAVLKRIQPQLQAKLDNLRRDEAAQAVRDAQAKETTDAQARRAEADRQREAAESEQHVAEARAEADRAKAQERAAAQSAEAERLKQVATATGAAKLLAVKALDCGHDQLKSLVKSGESAEVLASAVMTMCGSEVDNFVTAGAKEYVLERQVNEDDVGVGLAKEKLKADTREHFVALAVQAKAGVGSFAPASSN